MTSGTKLTILLFLPIIFLCQTQGSEQMVRRPGVMREGPGSFFPVVKELEPGSRVYLEETRGNWLRGRIDEHNGWMAKLLFERIAAGVDYAGMLDSEKAVVISSVDIAAATKGLLETHYAESHEVRFDLVDRLEQFKLPPDMLSRILQSLPPTNSRLLRVLPRTVFENTVILEEDAEKLLGRTLTATLVTPGFIEDENIIAYANAITAVIGAVTPRYDLHFRVALIDDPSISGFGLPGGNIVLTKGLLKQVRNEAELACLIGHEIAHITLYHGLREFQKRETHRKRDSAFSELDAFTKDRQEDLNTPFGAAGSDTVEASMTELANTSYLKIIGGRAREDELEADLFGIAYAAAAGYDPDAMIAYLERLNQMGAGKDAFRHHPSLADRIKALRGHIERYRMTAGSPVLHTERFQTTIAGLMAAENPK